MVSLLTCVSPPCLAARPRECAGSTNADSPASVRGSLNQSTTIGASGMSIAAPVLLFGMCHRASPRSMCSQRALYSSALRTAVASRMRMVSALRLRMPAFSSRCSSSLVSISRLRFGGRSPSNADSMMPWQGLALISRLPQACLNRHLVVISSMFDSPQVSGLDSMSASTSEASISRTVSAPSLFSTRLRCRP